jgi:hypothetical protein
MIGALLARPHRIEFRGESITLRRPTVADMVAAADAAERGVHMSAWLVATHVMDGDAPAFESVEQVMQLEGPAVLALSAEIEKLYGEGLDLQSPHAKS